MNISAHRLALELQLDPPTSQQVRAIEAPLEPAVLVAGAGSGKTATMAARVVWLVANELVRPEQVLGLTFTRKAARELASRVRRLLGQLRARQIVAADWLAAGEPQIGTYDSFTARLVGEHGLRLGVEPGRRLVGPSVAWQVAAQVVHAYDGDMTGVDRSHPWVVEQVLALHADLAGHLVEPIQLADFAAQLRARCSRLPRSKAQRNEFFKSAGAVFERQDMREAIVPLVSAYRAALAEHDPPWIDYASQAALGAELALRFGEVGAGERAVARVVLLDEYQDTSYAQLSMLRGLFGQGHPVTAVGDPCQSIYGWRGASTGSLAAFPTDFARSDGSPSPTHYLTTSFRNTPGVLAAANSLSEPLRERGFDVPKLQAGDSRSAGRVVASLHETADAEATYVADAVHAAFRESPQATAAVLVRTRRQIQRIVAALDAAAVPYQVIGVGGLLTTPEVADVVAALTTVADPLRGDALMRLLTGPTVRLGPRDLQALGAAARRRATATSASAAGSAPGTSAPPGPTRDEVDQVSIVDALDALPESGLLSAPGHVRARRLREDLRALRARSAQPLPDLVAEAISLLGLDVETLAARGPGGRANLDRFLDEAAAFTAGTEAATLPAFLAFLDAAAREERGLEAAEADVPPGGGGLVQILTVHAAKGLEWDVVFVVGLVKGTFPSARGSAKGWLGEVGTLPYPLRGDTQRLPVFRADAAHTHAELAQAVDRFYEDADAAALAEERRLAYVASTRARRWLSVSGYRWGDTIQPREPSPFLLELLELPSTEVGVWFEEVQGANPVDASQRRAPWPQADLLGARRGAVERGAAMVREAMSSAAASASAEAGTHPSPWARDVDLLLSEIGRRQRRDDVLDVQLPRQLSVSRLVQLSRDPDALAMDIRRPVPAAPAVLARRGTAFHSWLEQRWGRASLLDIDELPGAADETAVHDDGLAELRAAFLASDWARRTPLDVETPFELAIGGVLLRGRGDAIFRREDGGLDVVDWKTGPLAASAAHERTRSVQLAAYRLAFARLFDEPVERVSAAFHHVRPNVTVRPADLLDEDGLTALITAIPVASGPS